MGEVKLYGVAINTDECFYDLITGHKRLDKIVDVKPYGIYQDTKRGYQIFLYKTKKERDKLYKVVEAAGFEDFCKLDNLFAEEKK